MHWEVVNPNRRDRIDSLMNSSSLRTLIMKVTTVLGFSELSRV